MNQTETWHPEVKPAASAGSAEAALPVDDPRMLQAVQEYQAALEAGQKPDRQEFLARYADIAEALAECLGGLEFVHTAAPQVREVTPNRPTADFASASEIQPEGPLGDFRIVREIGRGGMGVVYEAEQISLGRRVALKVLPFAAALDAKQLQRFKNEAQAAAQLHHTNIVPVFGVGVERGVHYYAMQFIEGQTLAAMIRELRQLTGLETVDRTDAAGVVAKLASELVSGRWAPAKRGEGELTGPYLPSPRPAEAPAATPPQSPPWQGGDTGGVAALSTERSTKNPAFFRTVAQLGIQAAEALEHAHSLGVVHRDIKPANLLVDGRGNLWITDFGLAHCQSQAGLTMTGDLVGTLRYMSPEQALGQRLALDHRTDIYSLGATLYELLTLEPAFKGGDRQELLRQIAFEEPKAPRRVNKTIPAELETIVLKAMEKSPADRYATAQELADDLRRYLEDRPIRARRPGIVARLRKWSWRHRGAVSAAVVSTVLALAATSGVIAWQWRASEVRRVRAEQAEKKAQAMNDFLLKDLIGTADPGEARGRKLTVEEVLDKAAAKIDGAFPNQPEVEASVRSAIGETYVHLGLYLKAEPQLSRALELRQRALGEEDPDTLSSMGDMGEVLIYLDRFAEAEPLFRKGLAAARRALGDEHPTSLDFLHKLGWVSAHQGRFAEAVALTRESLAIRLRVLGPENEDTLETMFNLAQFLAVQGQWRQAEAVARDCERISVRCLPKNHPAVLARGGLVYVLAFEGKTRELEPLARENLAAAMSIYGPDHSRTLYHAVDLARALYLEGKFKEAEQLSRKTLDTLRRNYGRDGRYVERCQAVLGLVLLGAGRWGEAEVMLRDADQSLTRVFGPEHPFTLHNLCFLGTVLQASGKREKGCTALRAALDGRRKVLPSSPDLAQSLHAWAEFLLEEDDVQQAEAALKEALIIEREVLPAKHRDIGQTLAALGWALTRQARAKEGEPLLREGLEICRTGYPLGCWTTADAKTPQLDWATATAESRLGGCLTALGQFADAEKLLVRSYQTLQSARGTPPQRRVEATDRIVKLYETWGKADKAAAWRAKRLAQPKPPEKGAGAGEDK